MHQASEAHMRKQGNGRHEDLEVWKMAMSIAACCYRETPRLPLAERFGLQSQIRRAAVAVPSNIAEGAAGQSTREFVRYLAIAQGSLAELETQLLLCDQLGMMSYTTDLRTQVRTVRIMLSRLRVVLQRRAHRR